MTTVTSTHVTAVRPREARLAGLWTLLRFALRRDRVRLPAWILGITLGVVSSAVSFPSIYPTAEDRLGALLTIDNPGTTALIGSVYGDGDYTYGIMVGHELLVLTAVAAALMSILTLVRHTRAEEESGRAELVRSSVVGRHAHAVSAVLLVIGADVVLGLVLAGSLGALGVETMTWRGSLTFGAAVAAVGFVFAGVAAVTAQLTENARTASSSAGLVLALAYVLRAIGDVGNETASWFSPIGWAQATEAYFADDLAPLGLALLTAAVLLTVSTALSRQRDVGAGVLSTRPGPATAGPALGGPFGLTWRLVRGSLVGWTAGLLAFGLMYGPVLSEASTFLEDVPIMAEFLPDADATGAELFGATVIALAAIACAVPALQVLLRLRTEEVAGRAGPLLATPLSRARWMVSGLVLANVGGAVVLLVTGLGVGLGAGLSMDDLGWVGTSVSAAVSYLPAVAVTIGVAAVLLGWLPRVTGWSWALVVLSVVVLYFGGILDLPQWLVDLSPFSHVPQQPAVDPDGGPLATLCVVALALMAAGVLGVRRRDIQEA